jgi:transcriptional regulator with XRE-family HTH domain
MNLKQLRELKNLTQKYTCIDTGLRQEQYSRIENGKVDPSISTLEKLATVFEVDYAEFFTADNREQEANLPLMQKIEMINPLKSHKPKVLFKIIDLALANKRMKNNLQTLIAQ